MKDALECGFAVSLLVDASRALDQGAGERAVAEMRRRGAVCIEAGPPSSRDSRAIASPAQHWTLTGAPMRNILERSLRGAVPTSVSGLL